MNTEPQAVTDKRVARVNQLLPHAFSDHAHRWTVGMLKKERLLRKNQRRAIMCLPPVADYVNI
jgi:hypothetical protein